MRLKCTRDFQAVYREGKAYHGRSYVLICKEALKLQVGVVASKKVGNAVERNRQKRLMREAFRNNYAKFMNTAYLVIAARPTAALLNGNDAINEITRLFRKASLLD